MKPERDIIRRVLSTMDPATERLFRINSGVGWTGTLLRRDGNHVVLGSPRVLRAAPEGWPDLAGWRSVTITEDMVGQTFAVFRAVEVKAGKDRLRPAQGRFRDLLTAMGGVFEIERGEGGEQ